MINNYLNAIREVALVLVKLFVYNFSSLVESIHMFSFLLIEVIIGVVVVNNKSHTFKFMLGSIENKFNRLG